MLVFAETGPTPLISPPEMALRTPHWDSSLDAIEELDFPQPAWIVAFVVVSESGSFRAAAAELDLHEKSVRERIERLEEHVGMRLLERDRRGARLSRSGRGFYFAARAALAPLSAMARRSKRGRALAECY